MTTKRLLSAAAMYGVADIAVLAVGGFMLLPLYTRTLSQDEFGVYVAVRANIDLLTYLLHFGLPSAVARVYFDYRARGAERAYLSSVLNFFLLGVGAVSLLAWPFAQDLWALLSPAAPARPYFALSLAIAVVSFLAAIGTVWLRMEGRALATLSLQVSASLLLAALATLALAVLDAGLPGLLLSILASSLATATILPWLFGRGYRTRIVWEHVRESLRYAVPILVGYLAYFVLLRFSTLVLQRYVGADELAVFGLAQQLAMIVSIAATSFGMALQPAVYAAPAEHAAGLLKQASRILLLLMLAVATGLMLFSQELFALVAPPEYAAGLPLLLILVAGNFCNAYSLVSDTALLYHRRPKTSVAISCASAVVAALLSLWLIPHYHLRGAAIAVAAGLGVRMLLAHLVVYRLTGFATPGAIVAGLTWVVALAVAAGTLAGLSLPWAVSVGLKALFFALVCGAVFFLVGKKRLLHA